MKLSKQKVLHGQATVSDPRFSRLHFDPRFQRAFKRKLKIPIDSRFRHIFSDKKFADPLAIDKRGRPARSLQRGKQRKAAHSLHQYYDIGDTEDAFPDAQRHREDGDKGEGKLHGAGYGAEEEVSVQRNHGKSVSFLRKKTKKIARQLKIQEEGCEGDDFSNAVQDSEEAEVAHAGSGRQYSSDTSDESETSRDSSETSSGSSSSDEESDVQEDEENLHTEEVEEEEKVLIIEKETRRLALVNMDWDHLKAVDILAVMKSFLPKGGQILSVSVYPSEYGLQQMKEEETHGPQSLFETEGSESDEELADKMNMEKLRQYEISKLRYYYAVIECDSSATSDYLYKSCDGMEFERTSNTLDLRFIPDNMSFVHYPRDVATEVPPNYEAPVFQTRALQHSNVKLTWDDDEPTRVKTLHQKFNTEQLNEMDFKAYLASDASDDEDDDDDGGKASNGDPIVAREDEGFEDEELSGPKRKSRDKYHALLLGSDDIFEGKASKSMDKEMEITFNSGLDDLSKRLMAKKTTNTADETVWQAYLRKKKEKRKEQKKTQTSEDDIEESGDEERGDAFFNHEEDANFDDPFFTEKDTSFDMVESEGEVHKDVKTGAFPGKDTRTKDTRTQRKVKSQREKLEEERHKAELELLLADEHCTGGAKKGYNLKKTLKGKKKDPEKLLEKLPMINYDDPRFAAVFTSHRFAIDPTEPEFKRSAVQLRPLLEKQQMRISQADKGINDLKVAGSQQSIDDPKLEGLSKHDLSLLVRSLKRKVGGSG